MPLKTISLAIIANSEPAPAAAVRYAVAMAGRHAAHLEVRIGVPPLAIPAYPASPELLVMIQEQNVEATGRAKQLGELIRKEAETAGAIATVEILAGAYEPLAPHFIRLASVSDLCVAAAPQSRAPLQRDVLVDLLIGSGAPLLLVPPEWNTSGATKKAMVAWDGGVQSARAIRGALALLEEAGSVEIVSVLGEKDMSARAPGADVARSLARRCRNVSTNALPIQGDDAARTLYDHAKLTRSDLVVMGAYGHSRFREFILGGVTHTVLDQTDIPTLLSH